MQAEGFNYRGPCVWLVFSKCCSLTLPLPETGQDQGLLEQVLRQRCWAAPVTRTASGYLFIYFWGNT